MYLVYTSPSSSTMTPKANPLPNPHRYITDNSNTDGQSFFSASISDELPPTGDLGDGVFQRLGYTTDGPSPIQLTSDLVAYKEALHNPHPHPLVRPGGGCNVWYIDTPPGAASPMHRTVSLDVVIQVAGEIQLTLSNNETRTIKPGDMVVQRSTLHRWYNPSKDVWSRFVGIMAECQPVVTDGAGRLDAFFED